MEKKNKKVKKKKISNSALIKENQRLIDELNKYKDENLRLMADFENLKKRKNGQISDLIKYSGEELIVSLIPVFNDLDRILLESNNIEENKALLDGLKIIIDKLYKVLENKNIIQFESKGELFDPNLHEAMMTKDSKKKKNIIIEEFEKGYKYKDKIIRHSKVVVSKGS